MAQVFLGMSGGVDSSAAAVLLLERGYCVHGLHLSLLNTLPLPENCPPEDGSDARAVAQALELPFHDLDLSERFRQTVAAYFIREYEAGRTPNPCVFCNREIKFGAMWDGQTIWPPATLPTSPATRCRAGICYAGGLTGRRIRATSSAD